jgi:hypothetical protein
MGGAAHVAAPSRVNDKVVCERMSLFENSNSAIICCNHLQKVGGKPTPTEAT